jgi:glucokinase
MVAATLPEARTTTTSVIGVDLGGTKLLAGLVGPDLAVHHRVRRQAFGLDQPTLMSTIVDAVEEALAVAGGDVGGVGLGIPVTLDRRTGEAAYSTHLPIAGLPFEAVMSERLGLPVSVDNDGNCAVLAEVRHGAAQGASDVVMLTLGTGIGGGLVLGGRLQRGWIGAGAEFGHMVIDMDGPPCQGNCPNRGCLEVMASGSALVREAALRVARRPDTALGEALEEGRPLTGPFVTELAHDGDPVARDALEAVARALGVGLSSIVNMLNPEVIVIGGGVIAAGEMLLQPAREEMLARALVPARDAVRIVPAAFGDEAGMIGAALMAMEDHGADGDDA